MTGELVVQSRNPLVPLPGPGFRRDGDSELAAFQQHAGLRGDAFAATGEAQLFGGGGLDADAAGFACEIGGEDLAHRLRVRTHPGRFADHGDIGIAQRIAVLRHQQRRVAQELALQVEYLDIERERFSDRMAVMIDVPEAVRDALVPSLILQPLVENAVKHGVGATAGPVEIVLRARREAERLCISIENDIQADDGRPVRPGAGIGQRNVAERVRARFQADGRFHAGHITPTRYCASLELPLRFA